MASAAHAVLRCHELAANICENLAPLTKEDIPTRSRFHARLECLSSRHRMALVSLCRTCKALSEPAIAVLWRRLNDLDPFLKLFAQVRLILKDMWAWDGHYVMNDAILDDEWARFEYYAQFLRELDDGEQASWGYTHSTWTQLTNKAGGQPLFPRLKRLWCRQLYPTMILSVPLLAPSVHSLALVFNELDLAQDADSQSDGILRILESVRQTTLRLEHIRVSVVARSATTQLPAKAIEALSAFKDVQSLILYGDLTVHRALLTSLCELPRLESLTANIALSEGQEGESLPLGKFPKLRETTLRGPPIHLARFFSAFSLPQLQELSLNLSTDPPPGILLASIKSIVERVPQNLRRLELVRCRREDGWPAHNRAMPHPHSLMPIIEPALQLRSLEAFTVDFTSLPSVDDADIAQMFAAWPELTAFAIFSGDDVPGFEPRRPTASTLLAAATRCPKLRSLRLPQTDMGSARQLLPELPFPEHPLKTLIFDMDLTDAEKVLDAALFVDRLFPYIQLPDVVPHGSPCKGVRKLEKHLMVMQAGRVHALHVSELPSGALVEMHHLSQWERDMVHERPITQLEAARLGAQSREATPVWHRDDA